MPSSTPLLSVIVTIVSHTPEWVWGVLLLLIVLGGAQLRARRVPRRRVALLPLAMAAYSAWGAVSLFGLHTGLLLAWSAGMGLAVYLAHTLVWSPGVRHDPTTDRFDVPGSAWPLVLMLTVFAVRYGVTVTLAFHPHWAANTAFGAGVSFVYGSLSGLLGARALSILGRAQPALRRAAPGLAA